MNTGVGRLGEQMRRLHNSPLSTHTQLSKFQTGNAAHLGVPPPLLRSGERGERGGGDTGDTGSVDRGSGDRGSGDRGSVDAEGGGGGALSALVGDRPSRRAASPAGALAEARWAGGSHTAGPPEAS